MSRGLTLALVLVFDLTLALLVAQSTTSILDVA
jgi:hypothetical protein